MTTLDTCPICAAPAPTGRRSDQPWCCSLVCYRTFHDIHQGPSCHDAVTTICPVCQQSFPPTGRQIYCSDACRAASYRRRRDARQAPISIPKAQPRRPITIYECDTCGERALGEQRCNTCSTFMRRIGIGGNCPACDQPIAATELIGEEVITGP